MKTCEHCKHRQGPVPLAKNWYYCAKVTTPFGKAATRSDYEQACFEPKLEQKEAEDGDEPHTHSI